MNSSSESLLSFSSSLLSSDNDSLAIYLLMKEKIFQYFYSKKSYLEETKKKFEDKFHVWAKSENEIVEKKIPNQFAQ